MIYAQNIIHISDAFDCVSSALVVMQKKRSTFSVKFMLSEQINYEQSEMG